MSAPIDGHLFNPEGSAHYIVRARENIIYVTEAKDMIASVSCVTPFISNDL